MQNLIAVTIAVFMTLLDKTLAIQCYRCTVAPANRGENRTQQLCLKFRESEEFLTDCPYSTMCMKKTFKYELLNGEMIETVSRDCANQKFTRQVYEKGAWHEESSVEEPYEPGCTTQESVSGATTSTMYCHCRGSLCNSAPSKESSSYHTDAMAVIFVFNAMKYLRSSSD